MIEWIKQKCCKHGDMKIIEEQTYIVKRGYFANKAVIRKYAVCLKCGYKRKISDM